MKPLHSVEFSHRLQTRFICDILYKMSGYGVIKKGFGVRTILYYTLRLNTFSFLVIFIVEKFTISHVGKQSIVFIYIRDSSS